jgi:hypothetical protein
MYRLVLTTPLWLVTLAGQWLLGKRLKGIHSTLKTNRFMRNGLFFVGQGELSRFF